MPSRLDESSHVCLVHVVPGDLERFHAHGARRRRVGVCRRDFSLHFQTRVGDVLTRHYMDAVVDAVVDAV